MRVRVCVLALSQRITCCWCAACTVKVRTCTHACVSRGYCILIITCARTQPVCDAYVFVCVAVCTHTWSQSRGNCCSSVCTMSMCVRTCVRWCVCWCMSASAPNSARARVPVCLSDGGMQYCLQFVSRLCDPRVRAICISCTRVRTHTEQHNIDTLIIEKPIRYGTRAKHSA